MDRRSWWATVHRVAKSQTWLKRLSTHVQSMLREGRTSSTLPVAVGNEQVVPGRGQESTFLGAGNILIPGLIPHCLLCENSMSYIFRIHVPFWMYIYLRSWTYYFQLLLFSRSVVSKSLATPWTVAHQSPLSMWFSRQEYWNGLLLPSPGDLPDSGIKSVFLISPALSGRFFTTEPRGKSYFELHIISEINSEIENIQIDHFPPLCHPRSLIQILQRHVRHLYLLLFNLWFW